MVLVVQNLAFPVQDVDEHVEKASNDGGSLYACGQLKFFPMTTDFAYMVPLKESGLMMKFVSWKILGKSVLPPDYLLKSAGTLEKLPGKRSIEL